MKRTGLNGKAYDFSVSCETTDTNDTEDIHSYLMKKNTILYNFLDALTKYLLLWCWL